MSTTQNIRRPGGDNDNVLRPLEKAVPWVAADEDQPGQEQEKEKHKKIKTEEEKLDEALKESFPASDPPSVTHSDPAAKS